MKKILAGVLASASLLAMTTSAFATDTKAVKAAGEVEYDVSVTAPKIVLDLVLPAKMSAQLNPYGAEVKLDASTPVTNGVAGVAYAVKNNTEDYGIWVDATATTTVTAAKGAEFTVKAVDAAKKSASLALVAGNTVADIETVAADTSAIVSVAAADDGSGTPVQGALVMDSTVAANKTTGLAAGQTKQKKMMFVGAESEAYMAFIGDLGGDDDVEWTEDDAINVALVLKISAGAKTIDGSGSAGGPVVTNPDITLDASSSTLDNVTINGANATGTVSIDMSGAGEASFTAISDDQGNVYKKTGNYTVAEKSNTGSVTVTVAANGKVTFAGAGTDGSSTIVLTFTNTVDSLTQDVTFTVTESNN